MIENMFFLDTEHVGMGECSSQKYLLYLLSGGTTSSGGGGGGIPSPIPPRRLCMLIKGAA